MKRVWDDLANSPEEADDLAERADAIITLRLFLEGRDPLEVAARYGVEPKVLSDIQLGRIDRLSRDTLKQVAAAVFAVDGPLTLSE
jgi:predicted XRE-type DNA-binding protein